MEEFLVNITAVEPFAQNNKRLKVPINTLVKDDDILVVENNIYTKIVKGPPGYSSSLIPLTGRGIFLAKCLLDNHIELAQKVSNCSS